MANTWYSVHGYNNADWSDWDADDGYGSFDYDEAVKMAEAMETVHAAICVIPDDGNDNTEETIKIK